MARFHTRNGLQILADLLFEDSVSFAVQDLHLVYAHHEGIINEDGIQVVVESLGESSVNLSVRGWTKTEDYWDAYFSVLEEIKLAFDEEGIEIPFNYVNVNVIKN